MRWEWKPTNVGDIRIIEKFLLLPINLNGETRWLEKVKIKQEYTEILGDYGSLAPDLEWINRSWAN